MSHVQLHISNLGINNHGSYFVTCTFYHHKIYTFLNNTHLYYRSLLFLLKESLTCLSRVVLLFQEICMISSRDERLTIARKLVKIYTGKNRASISDAIDARGADNHETRRTSLSRDCVTRALRARRFAVTRERKRNLNPTSLLSLSLPRGRARKSRHDKTLAD